MASTVLVAADKSTTYEYTVVWRHVIWFSQTQQTKLWLRDVCGSSSGEAYCRDWRWGREISLFPTNVCDVWRAVKQFFARNSRENVGNKRCESGHYEWHVPESYYVLLILTSPGCAVTCSHSHFIVTFQRWKPWKCDLVNRKFATPQSLSSHKVTPEPKHVTQVFIKVQLYAPCTLIENKGAVRKPRKPLRTVTMIPCNVENPVLI